MINEEIKIYENAEALSKGFTEFIQKMLEVYPYINISLSGGTTPKAIFDYWAEKCKDNMPWERITFFWGDERCVPPENDMNNYGMARDHLFSKVPNISAKNVRRIHGENEPEEEAERYSQILERKLLQRNNVPCFELIMLGLGDDGHTVSVFPNQIELWDEKKTCVVAEHPVSKMKRVTLTGQVVNNAQYVVFLVMGKGKAQKVKDIIKDRELFRSKYPAARVNPKQGYLYWFMDAEAASEL